MFSVTYLNHHLQKLLSVNLLDPDYYRDQDQTNWEYCNIIKIKMRLGKWLKTHKDIHNNHNNNNNNNNNNLITISYQQSIDNNTKLLSKFTKENSLSNVDHVISGAKLEQFSNDCRK